MPTSIEINLQRLLSRCETMTSNGPTGDDDITRLEKYIQTLRTQMQDVLQLQHPVRPDVGNLTEYNRRIQHLSRLVETERLAKTSKKPTAAEVAIGTDHLLVATSVPSERSDETVVRQRSKLRAEEDMRAELLGQARMRKRGRGLAGKSSSGVDEDLNFGDGGVEATLAKERETQDRLTDQMVIMARALKDTTQMAGAILKEDNMTLEETAKLAEQNKQRLMTEHERLRKHMEVYGSCWIWLSLLIVSVVFVFMIVFIRLVPAPKNY
eukprot:comp6541_c0_seq1/m.2310 comp6541_c0_seq1/g.2310  ORF comp6541_c0_seq1/g.2310 comp6541_c0_seq1/m.2310 type:complete len:267 (-) comp6541_c0_seq1:314-1114(-)